MSPLNMGLIGIGTIFIVWFSWWASIKERRYHGIYRFFSFESILILVVNNKSSWFLNPFSIVQSFSWLFLLISIILALRGFFHLMDKGKPTGRFENTSLLITSGTFHFIRHPLYCSLLLLGMGIWLKNPLNSISIGLVILNTVALYLTARREEQEMLMRFGDEYRTYMKSSKMFIPFVF